MIDQSLILVVGACFIKDSKILMFRKNKELSNGGLFEFPGGKIQPGEAPEQALARELREELGIVEFKIHEHIARSTQSQPNIQLDIYRCELYSENFDLIDHDLCQWFGLRELDFAQIAPLDHEAIRVLNKN